MAKLVWKKTGDFIDLVPVDPEVYVYFVENLDRTGQNHYSLPEMYLDTLANDLINDLTTVDTFFQSKFDIEPWITHSIDPLDQTQLNHFHRVWVDLHLRYPNVAVLSDKIMPGMAQRLHNINKLIHKLEESFDWLDCKTPSPTTNFPNPFGARILDFGTASIQIDYNNLGRTTYNKWRNFDTDVAGTDTNDFKELYTCIIVSLKRPSRASAPKEYVTWADRHNIQPHGSTLNLAQFDKLEENLLTYRKLIYKNSRITENYFTLKE